MTGLGLLVLPLRVTGMVELIEGWLQGPAKAAQRGGNHFFFHALLNTESLLGERQEAAPRHSMWAARRMASTLSASSAALNFELVAKCSVSLPLDVARPS